MWRWGREQEGTLGREGKNVGQGGRREGGGSFCVKRLGADTQGEEVTKVACPLFHCKEIPPYPLLSIS